MNSQNDNRESVVPESTIKPLTDSEKALREAENGIRQIDHVLERIDYGLQAEPRPRLRPSIVCEVQRYAVEGIEATAGTFRSTPIESTKAEHVPPEAFLVPSLVEEMCDWLDKHWEQESALTLASYVLWRLNWIHPFKDGNGRTARALSYLVFCLKLGYLLPGRKVMPELIAEDRKPYYLALEAADAIALEGRIDLTVMENYLGGILAKQLVAVVEEAGYVIADEEDEANPSRQ